MECKGIQSKELSAKTKISLNTINSYLRSNGSLPDVEKALKIAESLDISVEMLVKGAVSSQKIIKKSSVLKPEIIEIERKLIHFSQKDLDIISQLIQSLWEKYK